MLLTKLNETNKQTSNNFKDKWKEFEQLKREGIKMEAVEFFKKEGALPLPAHIQRNSYEPEHT